MELRVSVAPNPHLGVFAIPGHGECWSRRIYVSSFRHVRRNRWPPFLCQCVDLFSHLVPTLNSKTLGFLRSVPMCLPCVQICI